jgi:hypothetical protein
MKIFATFLLLAGITNAFAGYPILALIAIPTSLMIFWAHYGPSA